jgi:UDP-N-acetylmuramate--alanine ligase
MNYYGTMERLTAAYVDFINGIPFFGRAVICTDCERLRALLGKIRKRHITYGTSVDCDLRAVEVEYDGFRSSFEIVNRGVGLGRVEIGMPGRHMVLNSLAAIVVGMEFGMDFESCRRALASFDGIMRRFEVKGERNGVLVIDDYGHHPTEIKATLAAAKQGFSRRIVAVFQPHRYSRVCDLFNDFVSAFDDADEVIVTDVYAAGESGIEGIDGRSIAEAMRTLGGRSACYVPSGPDLAQHVAARLEPGDLLLTMGAGDITRLGPDVIARLGR